VVGRQVATEPDMLRRIVAEGHALGDHTWSHRIPSLTAGWNPSRLADEIKRTNKMILETTGRKTCLFRPPGGVVKGARTVTRAAGLSMILWSIDPRDWAAPANQKFAPIIREAGCRRIVRRASGDLAPRWRRQPSRDRCRLA
jgi:peptidoglycan/xylan/chitin deacetylase (PgdA/CDA1 family)